MNVRTLIAVITYMVGFCGGVGPLQWVWIGELVPPEYKIFSGLIISICKYELARLTRVQDLLSAHHLTLGTCTARPARVQDILMAHHSYMYSKYTRLVPP
jgi:hypothetical protein